MKDSVTQSMDWLHTWGGLLFGWLLFVIFLTGTLTVFDKDITYWMQPELHRITPALPNLTAAVRRLEELAPDAKEWWIDLPSSRNPALMISWEHDDPIRNGERYLDPGTGDTLHIRDTRGGDFFYRLHYSLHLDQAGVWIVGASAMAMLAALATGIVIHRRIFKDFFTFRPRASSHRAWLDAHNVTSLFVLPFHLMITFTGLVIFWVIYMPAGVHLYYDGEPDKMYQDVERHLERVPAGVQGSLTSLEALEQQARTHWHGGSTEGIAVKHPGDRHALVEITRRADDRLALISDRVTFDGTTGELLQVWSGDQPAFVTYSVLLGLHYIWFDRLTIRWLYFFMGLAASAMIATGLVLWVVKREAAHAEYPAGYRLVERLNVSVVAGLLVAIGVYLSSNRVLPIEMADRALWEMRLFFLAWSACAAHSVLQGDARRAWREQLCAAGVLFMLLPLVNLATTERHLAVTLPAGAWRVAAVDLTSVAVGACLMWTVSRLSRRAKEATAPAEARLNPAADNAEQV